MLEKFDEGLEDQLIKKLTKALGVEVFNKDALSLEKLKKLFIKLTPNLFRRPPTIITIAGTNGKGQVALDIAHHLGLGEKNYCLWMSPHILSLRERFISREGEITYPQLEGYFNHLDQFLKKEKSVLSFYEYLFGVFCLWCNDENPQFLILEVGLGGRLDAVNIFDADFAGLTSISRDHIDILGHQLSAILKEKLGVLRAKTLFFSSLEQEFLRHQTSLYAGQLGCVHQDLFEVGLCLKEDDYRKRNAKLAFRICENIEGLALTSSFSLKDIPPATRGRGDKMTRGNSRFIFIGAHNVDGMRKAAESLVKRGQSFDEIWLGLSSRPLEDISEMMKILNAYPCLAPSIMVYDFDHPRALQVKEYGHALLKGQEYGGKLKDLTLDQDKKEKKILVSGSYFFLGEVMRLLHRH